MSEQTIWIGTNEYFLLPKGTIMPRGNDTLRNLQGDQIFSDIGRLDKYAISIENALQFILETQFPLKATEPEETGMAAQVASSGKKRRRLTVTVLEDPVTLKHETLSVKPDNEKTQFSRFLTDMETMIQQYRQEL